MEYNSLPRKKVKIRPGEIMSDIQTIPYSASPGFKIALPAKTIAIHDEENIIISPGPLEKDFVEELIQTKKPLIFVAPNNFHHFHIAAMKKLAPDAKFYGTKRASLQSTTELIPLSEFKSHCLKAFSIDGIPSLRETVFYHEKTKALIITDLVFNMHHKMNFSTRLFTMLAGTYHKCNMSRLVKMSVKDKALLRSSLEEVFKLDFNEVILNHGEDISKEVFIETLESYLG